MNRQQKENLKGLLMSGDKGSINQALSLMDALDMATQEKDSELIREVTNYLYEEGSVDNDYFERSQTLRKEMVRFKGGVVKDLVDFVDEVVHGCWKGPKGNKPTGSAMHSEKTVFNTDELDFLYSVQGDYSAESRNFGTAYNFVNCLKQSLKQYGLIQKDDQVYARYDREDFMFEVSLDLKQINFNKLKLASTGSDTMRKLARTERKKGIEVWVSRRTTNFPKNVNDKKYWQGYLEMLADVHEWDEDVYEQMKIETDEDVLLENIKLTDINDLGDNAILTFDVDVSFNDSYYKHARSNTMRKLTKRQASRKLDELYGQLTNNKQAYLTRRAKTETVKFTMDFNEMFSYAQLRGHDITDRGVIEGLLIPEWQVEEKAEDFVMGNYGDVDWEIYTTKVKGRPRIDLHAVSQGYEDWEMDDSHYGGTVSGTLEVTLHISDDNSSRRARFHEGPEGTKEFEKWKAEQPEEFQEEWDANTEKYKDKFKQAKLTRRQASRALDRLHAQVVGTKRTASSRMTKRQASRKLDLLHKKLTTRR